jgi:hypothetical protein
VRNDFNSFRSSLASRRFIETVKLTDMERDRAILCVVVALDRSSLGDKGRRDFNSVIRENIQNGAYTENVLCEDVPFLTNARLAIQKGTFVFSLNLSQTFHELLIRNQKVFTRLTVSATLFPQIRRKLNDFNCNSRVLFPGIDGYARYFKNHTSNQPAP